MIIFVFVIRFIEKKKGNCPMCRRSIGITKSCVYQSAFMVAEFLEDEKKKNVISFLQKKHPLF